MSRCPFRRCISRTISERGTARMHPWMACLPKLDSRRAKVRLQRSSYETCVAPSPKLPCFAAPPKIKQRLRKVALSRPQAGHATEKMQPCGGCLLRWRQRHSAYPRATPTLALDGPHEFPVVTWRQLIETSPLAPEAQLVVLDLHLGNWFPSRSDGLPRAFR